MIIPSGFAQINAIHTGAALPTTAEWTLGVDRTGFVGGPEDVAQAFETILLNSGVYDFVSNDVTMTSVLVKFGPNATGASVLEPANEPGNGGTAGAAAPAYLIHKNTSIGGRAGRGRLFLPGVPEPMVGPAGVVVGATVSGLNTAWSEFLADMQTADLPPVVLHTLGSPVSSPTAIDSMTCDTVVATQRRRQRR